jgi:hypothetical protein
MADDGRLRIAYVHDSPLHGILPTSYRDPKKLFELGFTDVVVADQMSGCLGAALEGAPENSFSELNAKVQQAKDAGLAVWLMDDIFTLPRNCDAGCPGRDDTWEITAQAIRETLEEIPEVRGLVMRFGETFDSPDDWVKRVDMLQCDCIGCASLDGIERRRKVVEMLENVVCREMGKRCILRLWDIGESGIHADRFLQGKVLSKWSGDPRFMVSVKHTITDYWRHQSWNPSIADPGPPRLVEFQCEREYEFIGMVPNWQGPEWSQGANECGEFGTRGLSNVRPEDWAGMWIIPLGGGWSSRHATSELWADMNVHTALSLCSNPERNPDEILAEWMQIRGLPDEARSLFVKSPDLILRLRYLDVWRLIKNQRWMPAENWFRDDNFVPGACAKIANEVSKQKMRDLLRSERLLATAMARTHLQEAEALPLCEYSDFIVSSYRWALQFAEWTEITWNHLLDAVPLTRDAAKQILLRRMELDPLPPLSVMD